VCVKSLSRLICSNGLEDSGEECDDGNLHDGDGINTLFIKFLGCDSSCDIEDDRTGTFQTWYDNGITAEEDWDTGFLSSSTQVDICRSLYVEKETNRVWSYTWEFTSSLDLRVHLFHVKFA
jgi:cysteine-rich repeat protein